MIEDSLSTTRQRVLTRAVSLTGDRCMTLREWPGAGTPVVLLHGLLDTAEGWDDLARTSARPFFAFDLPGFGGSSMPTRPRISAYAEDAIAGIDALGLDRCILVGHSVGGAVAVSVAESLGDHVAAMVLLAPAGFGRIHLAEAVSLPGIRNLTERVLPLALANRRVLDLAYRAMVTAGQTPSSGVIERVTRDALTSTPGAREATRAVVAAGLSERAFHRRQVDYNGPVRAIWGERDRLVPVSHGRALARSLPQAVVEIWPGMGHHPQHERPAALAEVVESARARRWRVLRAA